MVVAFSPIEKVVKKIIEAKWAPSVGKIGGELAYVQGTGLYIYISQVTGGGWTTATSGQWTLDIDVFGDDKNTAFNNALALEAALSEGPYRSHDGIFVDHFINSMSASQLPWEDENVTRVGSIWVVTARRSG